MPAPAARARPRRARPALARALASLVAALYMVLAPGPAGAAEPTWRWVGIEDGLEASHVNDVAQGPKGAIWIATQAGVWRWDGRHAKRMDGGAIDQVIHRVVVDAHGRVWARTEFGDLWRVEGRATERVQRPGESGEALFVSDLDSGRGQPLATAGADLWRPNEAGRWEIWRAGVVPPGTRMVRMHPDGRVLFGTVHGLWFLGPEDRSPRQWAESHNPWDIAVADDGSIWTGDGLRRIVHFDGEGRELWRHEANSRVLGVAWREGVTWVSCVRELIRIGPGHTVEHLDIDEGVSSGGRLLVGREGELWVASFRGLGQMPEPDARLWDRRHGLPGESIRWVERWDERVILHGWWGLAWLDDSGLGQAAPGQLDTFDLIKTRACRDAEGVIWAHVEGRRPDLDQPQPVAFVRVDDEDIRYFASTSPHHAIETCAPAAAGHVWLSGGEGLYRARGQEPPERVGHWPAAPELRAFRSLHEDAHGRLWAANARALCWAEVGLLDANPEVGDGAWRCTEAPGRSDIADIQDVEGGQLWIATTDIGVAEYDPDADSWRVMPELPELPGHHINTVSPSPRGGYWIAGYAGALRVRPDPSEGWVVQESLAAWLGPLISGANDVHEDEDGTLWVAGMIGVASIPPGSRTPPSTPPPLQLSAFEIDGIPLAHDRFEAIERATLDHSSAEPVVLPAPDTTVEIGFSAYVFRAPRLLRYRVRIDEGPWSRPADDAQVRLQSLAPGRHRVQAQASLDGQQWSTPATIRIEVPRPWYGRWQLWLGFAAIVGLVGLGLQRAAHAQRMRLERLRTRIALDLHDDVGAGLGSIQLLAGLSARGLPESARVEISGRIADTATELDQALRGIVWSLRPGSRRAHALGQHLAERARRALPEIDEAGRLELELPDDALDELFDLEVLRGVRMIASEALHNIARHAQASAARLTLARRSSDSWELIVEDDGLGLARVDERAVTLSDSGLGLPGMNARATEIRAQLEFGRSPHFGDRGTRIRLRFAPRSHRVFARR